MAVYKVPQDVEADDKLIGPFTFRQFIYLIIVALAIALAWGLGRLFLPLAIIPVPLILFFGALSLPLRKDQPMEIYLAAIVAFYLKPHRRVWEPDGIESLVEITAPKTVEAPLTKDISQGEAQKRLSYLAEIVDTQGWAVRGPGVQAPNTAINSDIYFEAQQADDILDMDNATAQSLDAKLDQSNDARRQKAAAMMSVQVEKVENITSPLVTTIEPTPEQPAENIKFNPYPEAIRQTVVQPIDAEDQVAIDEPTNVQPSEKPISADIINLANNPDLSIETIAREANRIQEKQNLSEEVVVSLR
jgi:hypothetical protein